LGVVVLVVMIFLGIFIFTRPEKVDYQYTANAQISENKGADMVKLIRKPISYAILIRASPSL